MNKSRVTGGFRTNNFSNSQASSDSNVRSTGVNFYTRNNFDNIAGKIGAVETRDYSVRRPQMKIGKT